MIFFLFHAQCLVVVSFGHKNDNIFASNFIPKIVILTDLGGKCFNLILKLFLIAFIYDRKENLIFPHFLENNYL